MSNPVIDDMTLIENELAALEPGRGLYFACSCVERLLPVAALWSEDIAMDVRRTLDEAWSLAGEDLPTPESPLIGTLEDALEHLTKNRNVHPKLLMYMADPAIPACYFFLKYHSELDTDSLLRCSEYAYHAVYSLSHQIILTIPIPRDMEERINSTRLVQDELSKQQQDLDRLKAAVLTDKTVQQIRRESQAMGEALVNRVQQYLQEEAANWARTQSAYLIGTRVEGYVAYTHPKGVVIQLKEKSYALAPSTDPIIYEQMFKLRPLLDKIAGIVAEYDEEDQFVILKLLDIHSD
jgi:hypothetical protein